MKSIAVNRHVCVVLAGKDGANNSAPRVLISKQRESSTSEAEHARPINKTLLTMIMKSTPPNAPN